MKPAGTIGRTTPEFPDIFAKAKEETDPSTVSVCGKALTILMPVVLTFAVVYLGIHSFVSDTKYEISTETSDSSGPYKLKIRCKARNGCYTASVFTNSAGDCASSKCELIAHRETKEIDVCHSPVPLSGVWIIWKSNPQKSEEDVVGFEIESSSLTSKTDETRTWIPLGFGETLLGGREVSKSSGLKTIGPVHVWDPILASSRGIFDADEIALHPCRQALVNAAEKLKAADKIDSFEVLITYNSPFRSAKLRVMPQKVVTFIKDTDTMSFLSQIGGIHTMFMAVASMLVVAFLKARSFYNGETKNPCCCCVSDAQTVSVGIIPR